MDIALALVPSQGFLPSRSSVGGLRVNMNHSTGHLREEQDVHRVSMHKELDLIYGSGGKDVVRSIETGSLIDIYA